MAVDEYESVSSIKMRAGVGSAARIVQTTELTFHRLVTDNPVAILVTQGAKTIAWPGGLCKASTGDIVALPRSQTFDMTNHPSLEGSYEAYWLTWDGDLLSSFANTHSHARGHLTTAEVVRNVPEAFRRSYTQALEAITNRIAIPHLVARHRLLELLLWLLEHGVFYKPDFPNTVEAKVRHLISEDLASAWSAERVASRLNMGTSTLRRKLAEERVSLREVLQDARMSYGLSLIQSTTLSMLEVGQSVGYDSASRFAVRFRSRFGFSPSEVRGSRRSHRPLIRIGS
ncbi:AraC family transcriptional regulator [Granulicella sp. S156]|uniref:helix-turn-helix transcriptional regulator n=1 Tax=Granulicella sp. S156 TaxID=1747224 RepID=UPI00131C34C0|nr:AraC family transcriptional regulator [Granulicella sp. S156]